MLALERSHMTARDVYTYVKNELGGRETVEALQAQAVQLLQETAEAVKGVELNEVRIKAILERMIANTPFSSAAISEAIFDINNNSEYPNSLSDAVMFGKDPEHAYYVRIQRNPLKTEDFQYFSVKYQRVRIPEQPSQQATR